MLLRSDPKSPNRATFKNLYKLKKLYNYRYQGAVGSVGVHMHGFQGANVDEISHPGRKTMTRLLVSLALLLGLSGCGSVGVDHYADQQPQLDLVRFFSQPVKAWGIFQKRSGEVAKRFEVNISSRREGEKLILDERFLYSDGTRQQRIWTLTPDGPGRWRGRADDVVGEARAELAGNALRWRYVLNQPVDGSVYEVSFDDWMYLMDEDTLINRSSMSKFGVELGQVTLFFRRQPS